MLPKNLFDDPFLLQVLLLLVGDPFGVPFLLLVGPSALNSSGSLMLLVYIFAVSGVQIRQT